MVNIAIKEAFFSPIRDADGKPTGGLRIAAKDESGLAPHAAAISQVYARAKGPKTLVRVPIKLTAGIPTDYDVNHRLTEYDRVFAVDTNTMRDGEGKVSVTAWVHLSEVQLPPKGGVGPWSFKGEHQQALEVRDAKHSPERLGWHHVLTVLELVKVTGHIALVVDSELGAHVALNAREQELVPGFFLPPNVTLIYASSDAGGTEYLPNAALAMCDKQATKLIEKIRREPFDSSRYAEGPFGDLARLHDPLPLD
jgi:hypothetical protein